MWWNKEVIISLKKYLAFMASYYASQITHILKEKKGKEYEAIAEIYDSEPDTIYFFCYKYPFDRIKVGKEDIICKVLILNYTTPKIRICVRDPFEDIADDIFEVFRTGNMPVWFKY